MSKSYALCTNPAVLGGAFRIAPEPASEVPLLKAQTFDVLLCPRHVVKQRITSSLDLFLLAPIDSGVRIRKSRRKA